MITNYIWELCLIVISIAASSTVGVTPNVFYLSNWSAMKKNDTARNKIFPIQMNSNFHVPINRLITNPNDDFVKKVVTLKKHISEHNIFDASLYEDTYTTKYEVETDTSDDNLVEDNHISRTSIRNVKEDIKKFRYVGIMNRHVKEEEPEVITNKNNIYFSFDTDIIDNEDKYKNMFVRSKTSTPTLEFLEILKLRTPKPTEFAKKKKARFEGFFYKPAELNTDFLNITYRLSDMLLRFKKKIKSQPQNLLLQEEDDLNNEHSTKSNDEVTQSTAPAPMLLALLSKYGYHPPKPIGSYKDFNHLYQYFSSANIRSSKPYGLYQMLSTS